MTNTHPYLQEAIDDLIAELRITPPYPDEYQAQKMAGLLIKSIIYSSHPLVHIPRRGFGPGITTDLIRATYGYITKFPHLFERDNVSR
jgi:hypothetical protein